MSKFIVAAKIQFSVDGVISTLGAASGAYFADASGLLNKTWYPILQSDVSVSVDLALPWDAGSPSQDIGDIVLVNGGDSEYEHVLDQLISAQVAGLGVEVKRGTTDQPWDELEQIFVSKTNGKRFDGESLILPQRSKLDTIEQPIATTVFDDPPNPRIVNRTVPLLLGPAFQIEPLIWDAPNQVYYIANNASNISTVREGGNRTDNFVETDFGFQLLAGSNLQITADAIGPEPTGGASQSAVVDWDFTAWTSGSPDDIDVTESDSSPFDATIAESVAGGEAAITVSATPTGDTGWLSLTSPFEPEYATLGGNDAWSAVGVASGETVEDAVVEDGSPESYAEAKIFGETTLRVAGFGPSVPTGYDITGVEIELIAESDNDIEMTVLTVNQTSPGTRVASFIGVSGSGITANDLNGGAKTTITGGGENFIGGGEGVREDTDDEDVNPGMHFTLKVKPRTDASATIKVYQVRIKVHYSPSIDIVRLFSPTSVLEPGERHTVTISSTAADIYARWGGSASSGGTLKDSDDPFSTSLTNLDGAGRVSFDFVPESGEAFFGIEFKRLNSAGTATIDRIKVEKRADGKNRYKTLVPYMGELVGLESAQIDQTAIDAHDTATGSPEMGWYVTGNESMAEVMDLFARSLSGAWWPDRDGKLRSMLWYLDEAATPDFRIENITVDGKPQPIRVQGNITVQSDPAPRATERAVGAKNWRPLRVSETAGITDTFTQQERANVIEDWRVRRRANFTGLNPWVYESFTLALTSISPTSGDEAGGTTVTATGTFDTGQAISFTVGGTSATSPTVVNSTTATFVTPAGTGASNDVVATQGAQTDTLAGAFEYTAAVTYAAFDPSNKAAGITLTNSDLTAEDGAASGHVKATASKSSGKHYIEFSWINATFGTATVGCGLANSSLALSNSGYSTADAWTFWGRGAGARHNSTLAVSQSTGAAETIGFAWDADTGELWISVGGTWIQGDPSTGTSPIWSNATGSLFPIGVPWDGSVQVTIHTDPANHTYSAPTGFTAGWTE